MKLEKYKDLSGSGGITGYKLLDNGIILQFKSLNLYLMMIRNRVSIIEQMKILAKTGKGLTTYVNQNVREDFRGELN